MQRFLLQIKLRKTLRDFEKRRCKPVVCESGCGGAVAVSASLPTPGLSPSDTLVDVVVLVTVLDVILSSCDDDMIDVAGPACGRFSDNFSLVSNKIHTYNRRLAHHNIYMNIRLKIYRTLMHQTLKLTQLA